MRGISPFAGAALLAHGKLFGARFVVIDRRGDIGGLCVDLGNIEGCSLPADRTDTYSNITYHMQLLQPQP